MTKQFQIKEALTMIAMARSMIDALNESAISTPALSELASESIRGNQELIQYYTKKIRSIRNGN